MSGEEPGEGFLSRWSRRKRAAEEAAATPDAPPAAEAPGAPAPDLADGTAAPADAARPAAEARPACPIPNLPAVDLASLPKVEELTAASDFSLFLRPGVPAALRAAALRRMWSLDPAIRDFIGPVEYQWDFNAPGGLPFGFSAELTGDIPKLLAQAIGKIEQLAGPEAEEAGPAPEQTVPADPVVGAEAAAEEPAAEAPPALPSPPAGWPSAGAAPDEAEPAPRPPPPRRHGRALPA
jgi:hypothetical protein